MKTKIKNYKSVTDKNIIDGFFLFGGIDISTGFEKVPRLKTLEAIDKWIYSRLEKIGDIHLSEN